MRAYSFSYVHKNLLNLNVISLCKPPMQCPETEHAGYHPTCNGKGKRKDVRKKSLPSTGVHLHIVETDHCTLNDGRTLAYTDCGDPEGIPIIHAHGGPGSRLEGQIFDATAQKRGYRIITTDRPGMGESTYLEGRKLPDYPADIAALADHLAIDRFGVTGWSGGGAHTTVCGYTIPERLLFNLTFAGYTNFAGMPGAEKYLKSRMDQTSVGLSQTHPRLFRFFFDLMGTSEKLMPEAYFGALTKKLCDADRAITADPFFKECFLEEEREAFRQGSRGVATDAAVHYVDWGFTLSEISCRLHVFHGTEDYIVPVEYARDIAAKTPHCELHILEGEGHFFPFRYQDLIFDTADAEMKGK